MSIIIGFEYGENLTAEMIKFFTRDHSHPNPPSHVFGIIGGRMYEAFWPQFISHIRLDKYSDMKVDYFEIFLPNEEGARRKAESMVGTPYGRGDCVKGGLHWITGVDFSCNDINRVNCSESWTRIVREGGINILPESDPDEVVPLELLLAVRALPPEICIAK